MKVGDLVRYKEQTIWPTESIGVITKIINDWSVLVAWAGYDYSYIENKDLLEVINESG